MSWCCAGEQHWCREGPASNPTDSSGVDPLQRRTTFDYDSAGRPTRLERPDGQAITLAYDSAGRLASLAPPGRPAHKFAYSEVGLLDAYTPPAVPGVADPATRYRYDAARRLTSVLRPTGDSITMAYDSAGRPRTVGFPDATITTTYNSTTGRPALLTSTSDGGQQLGFSFGGPLVTAMTQSGGGYTATVQYGYDGQLRLASTNTTTFSSTRATFGYDRDNLLTSVNLFGVATLTLARAPTTGLVTSTDLNGLVTTALTYDSLGNLATESAARSGQALLGYTLTRDSLDRIVGKTETVLGATTQWVFAYDSAGRLSQVSRDGSVAATYVYDPNGNRLSRVTPSGTENGVYDDQDRLITYGDAAYQYTAAGELQFKIVGTDTTEYHYDALGALRWVHLPDGTRIDYVIDALGRRIGRQVNGAFTQRFLYESDLRIAAEVNNLGQTTARFAYGTSPNVPEFMTKGGSIYRLLTDHLGSVRLVVRISDGLVAQRIDYDEFGRVTFNSAPGFQPFGYAGGLYDAATGLVRFGKRDYDSQTGRWSTPDPLRFDAGTSNMFDYVLA